MNANASLKQTNTVANRPELKPTRQSRLSLWLQKLPKNQLPLNPGLAETIRIEMREQESTSERLAALVQQDPALTLSLYQSAHNRMQAKEGDIQGLVHLIGLIGIGFIEDTLKPLQAGRSAQTNAGLNQSYAASLFAAHLCRELLPLRHGTLGERFFLPALLYGAPQWMMWQAAPTVMEKIHRSTLENKGSLNQVSKAKLGFGFAALFRHSRKFLQLQEITHQALAIDMASNLPLWAKRLQMGNKQLKLWLEDNPEEKREFLSPATGIFLVNQYALALYHDRQGKQLKRFENLLLKYLGLETASLRDHIKRTAQRYQVPGGFGKDCSPENHLDKLHDLEQLQPEAKNDDAIGATNLQKLERARDASQALGFACSALLELTAADNIIAFRKSQHTDDALKLHFHHKQGDEAAPLLTLKKDLCGAFFKKIQEKPVALLIDSDKLDKVITQMPKPLLRIWQPGAFSILSVFKDKEPYAIILCDKADWSNKDHSGFKAVGKTLSKSLKRL